VSISFQFDDLVEVFTDKLVAKIPSTCTGIVKEIKFQPDDVCLVGHPLLFIEVEGEQGSSAKEEPVKEEKAAVEKPAASK
jgi:pyruvate/2-oxoglutarate dehydrogenase complex dihydrolipoamide acyltransferase (E2) component